MCLLDAFSARNSVVFLCGEGVRLVHGFGAVAAAAAGAEELVFFKLFLEIQKGR